MRNWGLIAVISLLSLLTVFTLAARFFTSNGRPDFSHTALSIVQANGDRLAFNTEVADTPEKQSYGLMFIHKLPDNAAMIFPYSTPREVSFWMKNTFVPLDILFVSADHKIGHIVANAVPQDLTPILSQMPVVAVIEVKGGLAKEKNINVGDAVDTTVLPAVQ